jgi:hypothetical protein
MDHISIVIFQESRRGEMRTSLSGFLASEGREPHQVIALMAVTHPLTLLIVPGLLSGST